MGRRSKLVLLGDSVTAGYGLRGRYARMAYPNLLQRRFSDWSVPVQTTVSALEGINTSYALRRFHRMVAAHEPDYVVVLLGLNDAEPPGRRAPNPPETFRRNLRTLVDRILALEARPVMVTPNPRFRSHDGSMLAEAVMCPYVEAVREVAHHCMLSCVDLYDRFLAAVDLQRLLPDGIHPSAAGHRVIARALSDQLLPLFGVQHTTGNGRSATHASNDHPQRR